MIERDGPLSLSRQCALLGVSRSSQYYRPKGESAEDLALMRRMDELHMAYPFYGSRQLMRHLRREGVAAGRHRIRRLMRLMGMEATYRRPRTSVASPEHRVFPYLLRGLTISRADHVWCADITYVPVTHTTVRDPLGALPGPVRPPREGLLKLPHPSAQRRAHLDQHPANLPKAEVVGLGAIIGTGGPRGHRHH